MSNPCLDAVIQELDTAGVRHKVEAGGKHVHIRYGADLEHLHVVAATPSDWRAPLNERAQIRRDLAARGLSASEDAPVPEQVPVYLVGGEPACFSYHIAETFSKAHKDVLRAIDRVRDECGPEFDQRNFAPIDYIDAKGRSYRAYRMTRDGFSLVVMGFTGAQATAWKVKYIGAFNAITEQLRQLVAPLPDLSGIRAEFDALVSIVGDVEAKIASRAVPFVHPRQMERQASRRAARRVRA